MPRAELGDFSDKIIEQVDRLVACLEGLSADELNWRPAIEGANSLYVLAVHVMGNVQENVLSLLGGEESSRDRDAEFVAAGTRSEEVQQRWQLLRDHVRSTLSRIDPDALDRDYTRPRSGEVLTGRRLLLNTACHAAEHAGQAELTRDLLRGHL